MISRQDRHAVQSERRVQVNVPSVQPQNVQAAAATEKLTEMKKFLRASL